jgi:hypothetical protein
MTGEWLWAVYVSISRTDPIYDPIFNAPAYSTLNLRAMTGEWLGAVYVSISRNDPISPIFFGSFIYQYQELTLFYN